MDSKLWIPNFGEMLMSRRYRPSKNKEMDWKLFTKKFSVNRMKLRIAVAKCKRKAMRARK